MGMSKLGRYAYSMIDGATANNTFLVWMKLRGVFCAPRFFFCLLPPPTVYARLTHHSPIQRLQRDMTPTATTWVLQQCRWRSKTRMQTCFSCSSNLGQTPRRKLPHALVVHTNTPNFFCSAHTCTRIMLSQSEADDGRDDNRLKLTCMRRSLLCLGRDATPDARASHHRDREGTRKVRRIQAYAILDRRCGKNVCFLSMSVGLCSSISTQGNPCWGDLAS